MSATGLLAEIAGVGRDPVRGGYSRHVATAAEVATERGVRIPMTEGG